MIESQKYESQGPINFLAKSKQPILIQSPNEHLNTFFGGGLQHGMVTQLYGESGSGKTQTAMLFALGVHYSIYYIGDGTKFNCWVSICRQGLAFWQIYGTGIFIHE